VYLRGASTSIILRQLVRLRLALIPATRFFRFVMVGASGVDMFVLFLLSDPQTLVFGLTR
jgi:putative flippase GtrA